MIIWLLNKNEKKGGGNPKSNVFYTYHNAIDDNRQYLNLVHFETRVFCVGGRSGRLLGVTVQTYTVNAFLSTINLSTTTFSCAP